MDSYVTTDQFYNGLRELVGDLQPLPLHYSVSVDVNVPPEPLWFVGIALILLAVAVLWNATAKRRGGRHLA